MIDSPCDIFDLELEQHKFVEESQYENKNPVSTKVVPYDFRYHRIVQMANKNGIYG